MTEALLEFLPAPPARVLGDGVSAITSGSVIYREFRRWSGTAFTSASDPDGPHCPVQLTFAPAWLHGYPIRQGNEEAAVRERQRRRHLATAVVPAKDIVTDRRDRAVLLYQALRREELRELRVKDFNHARRRAASR